MTERTAVVMALAAFVGALHPSQVADLFPNAHRMGERHLPDFAAAVTTFGKSKRV